MNERIRLLAEKAGFETDRGPLIVPGPYIKVGGLCVGVPLEKFAELIIKECIRVPYNMWDKAELNADIAVKIENRIKQHFGVEE